MRVFEGQLVGRPGSRYGIIVSRFNSFICERLLEGALDAFKRHGVEEDQVDIVRVPGSWEIPLVAQQMSESGSYSALLALGAVIRGSTDHYTYVANESSKGIAQVGLQQHIPIINAILTTDSLEQAIERAGTKMGNKGYEAACTALEMVDLVLRLKRQDADSSEQ